jgi:Flp pilus assembly protein TadD
MSSEPPSETPPAQVTMSAAKRRRLQQCFEHATRNSKKGDFNYANNMFTQCVVGDPGNLVYLQSFLGNLQRKYNNNKKGGKLAGLKGAGAKAAIKKNQATKDWQGVIKAGCDMLAHNPWDVTTLTSMAHACDELEHGECQLFCLKSALDAHPKDPEVNRLSGLALESIGQFDQAIACWHRVELARPGDEEAHRKMGDLAVRKTIEQGGYEEKVAKGDHAVGPSDSTRGSAAPAAPAAPKLSPEQELESALARNPEDISSYLELADLQARDGRVDQAEATLGKAQEAAGGGNPTVRERLEDLQLQRGREQLEAAEGRAAEAKTPENLELLKRVRAQVNGAELDIYAARCERAPNQPALHYELGMRLKRAGQFNEAIQALQAARSDAKHKAAVLVELGESFHHIKQYKLAMANYEEAVDAGDERESDTQKLALYRAGKLALGLKDLERAEKHLTELAGIDYGYRDVAACLDKLNRLRNNE